jgi:hypothetical protein
VLALQNTQDARRVLRFPQQTSWRGEMAWFPGSDTGKNQTVVSDPPAVGDRCRTATLESSQWL